MANEKSLHDRTFKGAFSDLRVARDFFETHLPEAVQDLLNFDTFFFEKLLEAKFGRLPHFYLDRINQANTEMLNRWGLNLIHAQSLEAVFE